MEHIMKITERYFYTHKQNRKYIKRVEGVSHEVYVHRKGWNDIAVGGEMIFSHRDTYYTKDDFDEGLHTHDYYELLIYVNGDVEYVNEDTVMKPENLSAIWFAPGEMHTARLISASQYKRYVFYFSKEFFTIDEKCTPILDFAHNRKSIIRIPEMKRGDFMDILQNVTFLSQSEKIYAELLLKSYILQLFEILNAPELLVEKGNAHTESMALIKKYVDMEYANIQSVLEVAEQFYYSREHLSRAFKQSYNISISEYLRNRRVIESAKLLSKMSVTDAAYTVGFNNQSTYISAFKNYMGCLPSEYIRNNPTI